MLKTVPRYCLWQCVIPDSGNDLSICRRLCIKCQWALCISISIKTCIWEMFDDRPPIDVYGVLHLFKAQYSVNAGLRRDMVSLQDTGLKSTRHSRLCHPRNIMFNGFKSGLSVSLLWNLKCSKICKVVICWFASVSCNKSIMLWMGDLMCSFFPSFHLNWFFFSSSFFSTSW